MFKKDDYVVIITDEGLQGGGCNAFKNNYVYKINREYDYILVYLDCNNEKNGWSVISFNKFGINWRYATFSEINLYNQDGKPVEVSFEFPLSDKPLDINQINNLLESFNQI